MFTISKDCLAQAKLLSGPLYKIPHSFLVFLERKITGLGRANMGTLCLSLRLISSCQWNNTILITILPRNYHTTLPRNLLFPFSLRG